MEIEIGPERLADNRETEELTRDAFWDVYKPGCDEHLVLHKLRNSPALVAELDLVAREGGSIVGTAVCSRAKIVGNDARESIVLSLGPISVAPREQGKGIGGRLIRESLAKAVELEYRGVFLFGNPGYYARFGFVPTRAFGVTPSTGENFDAFMGLALSAGGLVGITGKFIYDSAFEVDAKELEDFERGFPPRVKHKLPSQLSGD
jgi:predicted N-acetyltransferase YhbS